jgi:hypothetical protein
VSGKRLSRFQRIAQRAFAEWLASKLDSALFFVSRFEVRQIKKAFGSHHVYDENLLSLYSMEDPQGAHNEVTVSRIRKIVRDRTHLGKRLQQLGLPEDCLNQAAGRRVIIERDMVGDLLEILKRRLGPYQASHRDRRFFASAWLSTRPSSIAFSPFAIPSRSPILAFIAS